MDYTFSEDWFQWAPEVWEQLIPTLPGGTAFLEIGSFEGRSTVWTVENMMQDGGIIICIDTWGGSEEHAVINMSLVEERFDANIALLNEKYPERRVNKKKGTSYDVLVELAHTYEEQPFLDFVYVDGSHKARDVLTDACLVWPMIKPGGILAFDDYLWGQPRDVLHRPKAAIDVFTTMFAEGLSVVHVGYQFIVKKMEG